MLLVDTNVLVDVVQDDPRWAEWSISELRAQAKIHELAVNPVIYAEMSVSFSTIEALDSRLTSRAWKCLRHESSSRPSDYCGGERISAPAMTNRTTSICRCTSILPMTFFRWARTV